MYIELETLMEPEKVPVKQFINLTQIKAILPGDDNKKEVGLSWDGVTFLLYTGKTYKEIQALLMRFGIMKYT